jgi:hypothetical protein
LVDGAILRGEEEALLRGGEIGGHEHEDVSAAGFRSLPS